MQLWHRRVSFRYDGFLQPNFHHIIFTVTADTVLPVKRNLRCLCFTSYCIVYLLLHCLLILVVVWLYKVIKTFSFRECFVREWFTGRWRKGLFSIWYTLYASFIFLIVVFNRTKCRLTKRSQLCLSRVAPCWRVQVIRNRNCLLFVNCLYKVSFSVDSSMV